MSGSINLQVRDRFRTPPCPGAPFNNPASVAVEYRLTSINTQFQLNIKTSGNVNRGIDAVYAVKVDNTYGSKEIRIEAQDSRDFVTIPAGCSGMFALYSKSCVFTIDDWALVSPNRSRQIIFYDTPQTYYAIASTPTGSDIFSGSRALAGLPAGSGATQIIIPTSTNPVFFRKITALQIALDGTVQATTPTALQVSVRYGPSTFRENLLIFRALVSDLTWKSTLLIDYPIVTPLYMRSDYGLIWELVNSGAMIDSCTVNWSVATASDDDGI